MKKHAAGFTLIEVLIALGILATTATILVTGAWRASVAQARDEDMLKALQLANNKMVETQATIDLGIAQGKFPDEKEEAGQFEEPFESYSWKASIRKVEIPLGGSGGAGGEQSDQMSAFIKTLTSDISKAVREVKVTVTWSDTEDDKPQEVNLVTHVTKLD